MFRTLQIIRRTSERGKVYLEVLISPLEQAVLSNGKALSDCRFLLVVQASISHLDEETYTGNSFHHEDIRIVMDRVVMKLADKLMPREAFTHHDVNLLLEGKSWVVLQ